LVNLEKVILLLRNNIIYYIASHNINMDVIP